MTRTSLAAGFFAALLALTACSSSSDSSGGNNTPPSQSAGGSGGGSAASGPKITIKDIAFSGTLTVKPGAKVTVVNNDSTAHTVTDKDTKMFDAGTIDGGGTSTFTAPDKPGKYPFGCNFHSQMKGTLVVQG